MWTLQNRTPLLLTAKVLQLQEGLLGPLEAKKATLHLEDDFTTKQVHKGMEKITVNTLLTHTPSMLLYCFSAALFAHQNSGPRPHKEAMSSPNATK